MYTNNLKVTFPEEFKKYDKKYEIYDCYLDRKNFKILYNSIYGYSLMIDEEEEKRYFLVDPNTNDIKFFEKEDDLLSEFFLREYKDFRMKETLLIEKVQKYRYIDVKTERVIESLFRTIYNSMSFEKKMEYMKHTPNSNTETLDGINKIEDVKIKITSKTEDINEVIDCSCIAITEGGDLRFSFDVDNDLYVGYLFMFESGYIEVIYKNYSVGHDLGSLSRPISSKIVIDDESFDGFFKEYIGIYGYKKDFSSFNSLYRFLMKDEKDEKENLKDEKENLKEERQLEFIIGLEMPKLFNTNLDYYGNDYYDY